MDFFEQQDLAKKQTRKLIVYFALTVVMIVLAVYLVIALPMVFEEDSPNYALLLNPALFLGIAFLIGGIIGGGSVYKVRSLSSGGKAVAEMLDGERLNPETKDPDERRLLNVVEEMSIASGVPVPPVYVIEGEGINAFAAGFQPSDAVIGVTRGTLEQLDRNELQGVIAHEFSHILYGDMRLNIRLIGVLFGILMLAFTGLWILRSRMGYGRRHRRSSRGKNSKNDQGILFFGIALLLIGLIGVLMGRLIKSAISRQREFLADAAAVQFTRYPDGIAGALSKIGGGSDSDSDSGKKAGLKAFGNPFKDVGSAHTEEASHMFFADANVMPLGGPFATHPPIPERIRRIGPSFDVEAEGAGERKREARAKAKTGEPEAEAAEGAEKAATVPGLGGLMADPAEFVSRIGSLNPEGLACAVAVLQQMPDSLRTKVRSPQGARAAIYCLLLSKDETARAKQKEHLKQNLDEETRKPFVELSGSVENLPAEARMPLVELAMPALQQQDEERYREFREMVDVLTGADNKVSIFEFALGRNLMRHLEPVFGKPEKAKVIYHDTAKVLPHCLPLLALLARYGNEENMEQAQADFAAGVEEFGGDPEATDMPDTEDDPVNMFAGALDELRKADGELKKRILAGCVAAILGNRKVTIEEAELLRAVADSLDCPMPPITVSDRSENGPET